MNSKKLTLIPPLLRQIPSPPKQLWCAGANLDDLLARPRLAIVGSRNVSPYGKQVTLQLSRQLAEQGVVIVSGLALGVDGLAHQAALEAQGLTIAVLPSSPDIITPATNYRLAEQIVAQGGALVSEYPAGTPALKQHFIARNRLIAGLADAVLITEAAEKSGSLHTATFAQKQGKPVLVVPGNITSQGSAGTNNLLKAGATPVTAYTDVLDVLGLQAHQTPAHAVQGATSDEQRLLHLILRGVNDGAELLRRSGLTVSDFNQVMTMLEIGDKIRALGNNQWALV